MKLSNWALILNKETVQAPESSSFRMIGQVYGSRFYRDGTEICTSEILRIRECGLYKEAETINSVYRIYKAEVHPHYEELFHGSYDRLRVDC